MHCSHWSTTICYYYSIVFVLDLLEDCATGTVPGTSSALLVPGSTPVQVLVTCRLLL